VKVIFCAALVFIGWVSAGLANAEVEKIAIPTSGGMRFYWWPKISPPSGWQQDEEFSFRYSANAMVPRSTSFRDAPVVMYAKAEYKPRMPDIKSIELYIESDHRSFKQKNPGIEIRRLPAQKTVDAEVRHVFRFEPYKLGNWEKIAYMEEDEFYFVFVVSARSKEGLDSHTKLFDDWVGSYKK
jgi:hypothetical protein